ncbi:MAG TPA: archaellin/type IV pilin N-terminal domain-containing protein, partial [archaeon]|nr:archaellin/type IV pilin N-terminal domain-containing protein [archaeon]
QIMKGISPLIATVLLVVIVVAIGTMVMTWSSTFTTSTTRNVQNRSDTAFNCASANIIIEDVYLVNGSLATVRAIVKNIGVVDVLISAAQAYNTTGGNFTANGMPFSGFNAGNIVTLQFSNVSMTKCSDFSKVVVSTSCSGVADTFIGTPKCS